MNWKKLGQLYKFKPINNYLFSHAANPLAIHLKNDIYRVLFSSRDISNRSSVGYVDIDIIRQVVVSTCGKAIFQYGLEGSFFSHGVSIGNVYQVQNANYIQFMGWQVEDGKHWRGDIGRLKLNSNYSKLTLNPNNVFIGCDEEDRISLSYPWVIFDEGIYKMWYGSTIDWSSVNGEMVHVIKYATSKDGDNWHKHGLAVSFEIGVCQAFSRPSVIRDSKGYHMWYSFRGGNETKYRIGYAHSNDGLKWNRKENSGIDVSNDGWDNEMICYPFVFEHKNKKYMLYNGNSYGQTGFGLAVLEE